MSDSAPVRAVDVAPSPLSLLLALVLLAFGPTTASTRQTPAHADGKHT